MIKQYEIKLPVLGRGFHLIDHIIRGEIKDLPQSGLVNIFLQHTSAALALNENADPTVRMDFESFVSRMIPDDPSLFKHTLEGPDDMPAHLKSSLFGQSVTIPVTNGKLKTGTWQGIYLCEFRDHPQSRKITVSVLS